MDDFGSWFKSKDVVDSPGGEPCRAADLRRTIVYPAAPRIVFNERDPRAFVFDWQPGVFDRADIARFVVQLVLHPGEVMSVHRARGFDTDLPQKIKSRRRGDCPMDIDKFPFPFNWCIVKASGNRGFYFDPSLLPIREPAAFFGLGP